MKVDPDHTIHLGREANERLVKNLDLSKYRTVAFATHGLLAGDLGGLSEPALALTAAKAAEIDGDGLLSMAEILTLKLDAAWVVLSACNSGAGYEAGAEAASGLARAFFYAGTRAVLATNWPVNSASARLLVSDLFERQAANPRLSRAEALRGAMVAMIDTGLFIDSTGKPAYSYAHPMFWAAYSLFGDGAGSAEYGASVPPSERTAGVPAANPVPTDVRRSAGKVGEKVAVRAPPVQPAAPASRGPVVAAEAGVPSALPQTPGPCNSAALAASRVSGRGQPLSSMEECALKQKDAFRECDKCPEMVVVSTGSFTMGSPESEAERAPNEGPQHDVIFARPFAVGKFHVTVDQFAAFVSETGYTVADICWTVEGGKREERSGRTWRNPGFPQTGQHPAVCVSWNDAQAYVEWLRRKTGKNYRLLTEAEWEYAARARTQPGTYPRYLFGDDENALCRYGNGADQTTKSSAAAGFRNWTAAACKDGYAYTSPVGQFAANDFGLYDMQGNAFQWTQDCYHGNYNGSPSDGSPWMSGNCGLAIMRGGSWNESPQHLRPAFHGTWPLSDHRFGVGFRVARTLAN